MFLFDGDEVPFTPGQTLLEACLAAGRYVAHLCWSPGLAAHNSCRMCLVEADGRLTPACASPAADGMVVRYATLAPERRALLQLLFAEGDHVCPACERSGDCRLQASAYAEGVTDNPFPPRFPRRDRDASHPDVILDRDRCILCALCVRASHDVDHKGVFAMGNRGIHEVLLVNSPSGLLRDTPIAATDAAVKICPVGALLPKRVGFDVPIGQRTFDRETIDQVSLRRDADEP